MRPRRLQVRQGRWVERQWPPEALPAAGGQAEGAQCMARPPMWLSREPALDCGGGLGAEPRAGPETHLPGRTSEEPVGAGRPAGQGCSQRQHTP